MQKSYASFPRFAPPAYASERSIGVTSWCAGSGRLSSVGVKRTSSRSGVAAESRFTSRERSRAGFALELLELELDELLEEDDIINNVVS